MKRISLLLVLLGCGADAPPGPAVEEPATAPASSPETLASEEESEPSFTPGQQQARAEGQFAAQDDLARGIVRIVDFELAPSAELIDERTGLPMGTMPDVESSDRTAWRDAYNDTVLAYVAETPPFPEDLRLSYTVSSHPDGVRHLRLEVTADAVLRQREGLDSPVEISLSERYQLGILAQRSRATITGRELGPGLRVEFVVESDTGGWSYTSVHPAERIGSSSVLGQLLETIAQR